MKKPKQKPTEPETLPQLKARFAKKRKTEHPFYGRIGQGTVDLIEYDELKARMERLEALVERLEERGEIKLHNP